MATDKDWQESYYDGDDLFAPEEELHELDVEDDGWYYELVPTTIYVSDEEWDFLVKYLEEDDGTELE